MSEQHFDKVMECFEAYFKAREQREMYANPSAEDYENERRSKQAAREAFEAFVIHITREDEHERAWERYRRIGRA